MFCVLPWMGVCMWSLTAMQIPPLHTKAYGRGLDLEIVERVNEVATGGLLPDLTFLLDLAPAGGLARVQPQLSLFSMMDEVEVEVVRQEEEGQRGFEMEPIEFHRRVRQGYLEMADREPERWVVLDATRPRDSLAEEIRGEVSSRLGLLSLE